MSAGTDTNSQLPAGARSVVDLYDEIRHFVQLSTLPDSPPPKYAQMLNKSFSKKKTILRQPGP